MSLFFLDLDDDLTFVRETHPVCTDLQHLEKLRMWSSRCCELVIVATIPRPTTTLYKIRGFDAKIQQGLVAEFEVQEPLTTFELRSCL